MGPLKAKVAALARHWMPGSRFGVIAILSLVLLSGLVLWGVALWSDRQETLAETGRRANDVAVLLDEQTRRAIRTSDQTLLRLVEHFAVDDPATFATERNWQTLRDVRASLPEAHGLWVFGPDGSGRLWSEEFPAPAQNVTHRSYFQAHREGYDDLLIGPYILSVVTGTPIFTLSRRIGSGRSDFKGVVMAGIGSDYYVSAFQELNMGPRASVALYHRDGYLVARWPKPREANPLPRPTAAFFAAPAGTLRWTSPFDGVERIVSYREVKGFPLVVAAGLALDDALVPWRERLVRDIYVAVPLLLAFVLLGTVTLTALRREADTRSRLRDAIDEKDVLFREVHHRVKNNLQVISSLLTLQMRKVDEEAVRESFRTALRRIYAMGLIHEELYSTNRAAEVDFGEYLKRLCNGLSEAHAETVPNVRIEVAADRSMLSLDLCVSAALIANEIVINALKHAFPDDRTGTIVVRWMRTSDGYLLEVADDGIGLEVHRAGRKTGAGDVIVQALARQIGAKIQYIRQEGTTFRMHIPLSTTKR